MSTSFTQYVLLFGRILLSAIFLLSGAMKL